MSEYREREHASAVVATVKTPAEAGLLRLTLVANGFEATVAPSSYIPSVDFVQGLTVSVRAEDADAARRLLRRLDLYPEA